MSNTAKQILILQALGASLPVYAHLPLIHGPDRKKLSKRHGAASTLEFREAGFLPEALLNYLALIGWSLDDKTEILSREELIQHFSLERINKAAGIFDHEKLLWMNGVYIRALSPEDLERRARETLKNDGFEIDPCDSEWFQGVLKLVQERIKTLKDLPDSLRFFFVADLNYDEKAVRKFLKKEGARDVLKDCLDLLSRAEPFTISKLEDLFRDYVETLEVKFGKIAQPLRVALTGTSVSPPIFEVMYYLGRERCAQRIARALEKICSPSSSTL